MVTVRHAEPKDREAVWNILEPVIREGTTYALPREMNREEALAYWFTNGHEVFVAETDGRVVGTYFLRANQQGGGRHVANCGYMTHPAASGKGIASVLCSESLRQAKERGFLAMQFNFVVSTNERAIRLWQRFGFEIVGRLPGAFLHPELGYVDALVLYRRL